MALDPKIIDDLARKLADAVPDNLRGLGEDMEKNFHAVLAGVLGKMDIVTREEFDVQAAVLARTREKLEKLAQRLAELDAELQRRGR